jgi:osmotically-inducible protein OsmY
MNAAMLFLRSVLSQSVLSAVIVLSLGLGGCSSFVASTTNGPVGVVSGDRSFAQVITDNGIVKTAEINLYKLDPRFNFSRVNVSSFHSVVLLTGQVPDEYLKTLAEQNVRSMTDVKAVHNYLTVGEKADYNTIVNDSVITANVRKNILLLKAIKDTRVKIVTEQGVVYVMGRLMADEAAAMMDVLQRTPNIVKIVSLIDNIGEAAPTLLPANTSTSTVGATQPSANMGMPSTTVAVTPLALEPRQTSEPLAEPALPANSATDNSNTDSSNTESNNQMTSASMSSGSI